MNHSVKICCSFGTNSTDCDEDKSKINFESSINLIGPNKKNKCVSGNGSENFRQGRHTYFLIIFFSGKKYNFMHFESAF